MQKAQDIAAKVTAALGGAGLWGVEFFITENDVYFSELSPRPHDTGMVTLANTQNYNQFELHTRAVLGLPIPEIVLKNSGASAVILATENINNPQYNGIATALLTPNIDIKIFGKPNTRPFRRMGIALANDIPQAEITQVVALAKQAASQINIT